MDAANMPVEKITNKGKSLRISIFFWYYRVIFQNGPEVRGPKDNHKTFPENGYIFTVTRFWELLHSRIRLHPLPANRYTGL